MPATLDVSCPNCETGLKVPAELEGKRIRCKKCQETFLVRPKAAKPAAKPATKPAAPPPAADAPIGFAKDKPADDDDDNTAYGVEKTSDVPRCPHCTQEMDPPDAIVCTNCGFNNRSRVKAETKKVWEPTAGDWTTHLLPGIVAVVVAVTALVIDIVCAVNMREWMTGGLLDKEEVGPDGGTTFYVKPGAFSTFIVVASIFLIVPCLKFAYKRLVVEFTPPEQVKLK